MRRPVISFFLLSLFALSSSNIIPLRALHQNDEELGIKSNLRDNTPTTNPCTSETFPELCKILNRRGEPDGSTGLTPDPNKGFRMDKWHGYPKKFNYEAQNDDGINRFLLFGDQDDDKSLPLEDAVPNNDLNNKVNAIQERPYGMQFKPGTRRPKILLEPEKGELEYLTGDDIDDNDLNSAIYMLETKKKEVGKSGSEFYDVNETPAIPRNRGTNRNLKTVVKKRYISLWSRLQAMSPPNHAPELPHRRHLHLFYHHLPEDIDGRPIPEDPRALFKRPPGSPLRWG